MSQARTKEASWRSNARRTLEYIERAAMLEREPGNYVMIGAALGLHTTIIRDCVNALITEKKLRREVDGPQQRFWVPGVGTTPWSRREMDPTAADHMHPACIACGQGFRSNGPHNRICPRCTLRGARPG